MTAFDSIRRIAFRSLVGLLALLPAACGLREEDRLAQPAMAPDEIARKALEEYDANKDGTIAGDELDRCPALKNSLEWLDKNKDGKLSGEEIADRIRDYQKSKIALMTVGCQVTLDGKPLPGAAVTFVPEKFMGPAVKSASGKTDEFGSASLTIAGQEFQGVNLGFYKVEVSLKDADGKELLPARYNAQTVLGQEVGPRVPTLRGGVKLTLSSGE